MIYHALAAIFILVTASIYLEDVRRITSESKQAFNTINNHISQHFQNLQFEFNVNNEEAIAAGVSKKQAFLRNNEKLLKFNFQCLFFLQVLALFQAFLYGLVAYVIWRKGWSKIFRFLFPHYTLIFNFSV